MSSSGMVPLKDVWAMLDVCAPGWKKVEKTHNYIVMYKTFVYSGLPKKHTSIEIGHIKSMARKFGILECAKTQIERMC